MLRIRDKDGELVNVKADPYFVEICDDVGAVGMVFYQPDEKVISQIGPESEESKVYSDKYGVEFVKFIDLTQHHEDIFKESSNSK